MRDYTKIGICLIGGVIFTILYRNKKRQINEQIEVLSKLKNLKALSVSQIQDAFSITDQTEQDLFIEGRITSNTKLLKSHDKTIKGVLIKKKISNVEIIETQKARAKRNNTLSSNLLTTDSFLLTPFMPGNEDLQYKTIVTNFSQTSILPKILKYNRIDQMLDHPETRQIMREPQTDAEKAQFKSGNISPFLTTILKLGIQIQEEILCEGTFICVYGKVIKDQQSKVFQIIFPKYFGESKEQIINYIEADQFYDKFLAILCAFGGALLGCLAIKYLYHWLAQIMTKQPQENQNEHQERQKLD